MSVKLTPVGEQKILEQIEKLKDELKYVREEKNIAYTLCGDTWHDNPHFNKLEQDEKFLDRSIREIEHLLTKAERITLQARNIKEVSIGSIVKCYCKYPDFEEIETYEIVGYGESDLDENKIVYDTPVAQNLIGLKCGEQVVFDTPTGKTTFKIIELYAAWDDVKK